MLFLISHAKSVASYNVVIYICLKDTFAKTDCFSKLFYKRVREAFFGCKKPLLYPWTPGECENISTLRSLWKTSSALDDKVSVFVTFSGCGLWKTITHNFEACIDVICLLLECGV